LAQYLVVVESPAKAKTIGKYLGREYVVKASVGHVKDLPKSKLGVDLEEGFVPAYEVIRGKGKVLQEIKKAARGAERVFLAPDPDREGEAIAWHIAQEIDGAKGNGKKSGESKVVRVLFNEITKRAIQEAMQNPAVLDENKYNSQQARRILDRLVGYQISPLLWRKVRRGLSAGRVQSVAVRLVVEREREIDAFRPEEYWTVDAHVRADSPPPFVLRLVKIDGKKAKVSNEAEAKAIEKVLKAASLKVSNVERKERKRNAPPPFITSRLQQEAANRLRFTAKKTMTLAQRLYEGVELGSEGAVGLITYMRTDSPRLSDDAIGMARGFIEKRYGKEGLPEKPNFFRTGKKAQDAHEAIRPTSTDYPPEKVKRYLERDAFRLYELIWKRFIACQMAPALYDQTRIEVGADRYLLQATGSILKKPGWLAAYGERTEEDEERADKGQEDESGTGTTLPDVKEGDALNLEKIETVQHFTQPPPRFNEASLVKELEDKGIGRPSTYASILSTIQDKEYVKKEENRFHPTELGFLVTDLLVESFPKVMDVAFTARLENDLDEVEEGKADWQRILGQFYEGFQETLAKAEEEMRDVKREEIPTDLSCEKCGSQMVIKWGRNGRFLACSAYPDCKFTADFREKDGRIEIVGDEPTGETCHVCGKPMVIKRGRFGRFLACSGYPDCKTSRPISVGVDCPECGKGYFAERRSKRGKVFYGCSNYPECKTALWDRPVPKPCPQCNKPYLLLKTSKRSGSQLVCADKDCGYKESVEEGQAGASTG
jgi:DNA topoisomerase I